MLYYDDNDLAEFRFGTYMIYFYKPIVIVPDDFYSNWFLGAYSVYCSFPLSIWRYRKGFYSQRIFPGYELPRKKYELPRKESDNEGIPF